MTTSSSASVFQSVQLPVAEACYINFPEVHELDVINDQVLCIFEAGFMVYIQCNSAEDATAFAATIAPQINEKQFL